MNAPSVLNGSETVTASYIPKTPWEVLVEVCKQENVIPEIIVHWGDFRDQHSVVVRTRVLRKLLEQLKIKEVQKMSGISLQRLYQIQGDKRGVI